MEYRAAVLFVCAGVLASAFAAQTHRNPQPAAACGPLAGQLFKCPQFGFTYKVPFGWVNRTQEMQLSEAPDGGASQDQAPSATSDGEKPPATKTKSDASKSRTLLAVFERPPGAAGETINSAVVIATEPRESYPQIKTAADYFGPISDLATQSGFKPLSDPYAVTIAGEHLVREDFSAERGKVTMLQSSLVVIEKGEIISFTFISGDEDDVEDLIASLSFATASASKHARP